jgi:DNA-binding SARP family transcriptional activator
MTAVAELHLLGRPGVARPDVPAPAPRGHKVWALLAHLVLTDRPAGRTHLAELLFSEAADPLRALRWNVSELRRTLRGLATLDGDPVVLHLVPGCTVDVVVLAEGTPEQALAMPGFGHPLLEGIDLPTAPGFEAWLAAERARLVGCTVGILVERSLDMLGAGAAAPAARLAARAVAADPLDADHHALLVRCLRAAGDEQGARRQALRSADLLRRELGGAPPAVLLSAARPHGSRTGRVVGPVAVLSLLEAGRASLGAGVVDRGLDQLRSAAALAADLPDPALRADTLVALAAARVHGTGERGTEVRGLLQEAAVLARRAGAGDLVAAACRELAFLALQRGQHDRALVRLDDGDLAATDEGERARLAGVRGMCLSDRADYPAALAALARSVELAELVGDRRQAAWAASMVGRVHVLRGDHDLAVAVLDPVCALADQLGWTAFRPWPDAFRAEAATALGDLALARHLLDRSWVLAGESGDNCWLAVVAHGQTRLATAGGDRERALRWAAAGLRPAPWYLWTYARLLDAACTAAPHDAATAERLRRLVDLAARAGLRDLLVRAHLHKARAGSAADLAAARALAEPIDDLSLRAEVGACGG